MTPQEAIEKLEEFQNNIVHGSSIFRVIADVIREQAKVKTIHVQGRLTPSQRDTITGAVKWIERIVNRKDELPPLFLDNINPAPLAKELRAMLSENAKTEGPAA